MLDLKANLPDMAILWRVLVYKIGQSDHSTIEGSFTITVENHREILVATICHFSVQYISVKYLKVYPAISPPL